MIVALDPGRTIMTLRHKLRTVVSWNNRATTHDVLVNSLNSPDACAMGWLLLKPFVFSRSLLFCVDTPYIARNGHSRKLDAEPDAVANAFVA